MKLQFKYQQFQADAAKAVVDVFAGQPKLTAEYIINEENKGGQGTLIDLIGRRNHHVLLPDELVREQIQKVQKGNGLEKSPNLEGKYNLTIEMETGVGKTYTYIKTMYELNKHYGWSKFIVVVPSVAIREGVSKSFEVTSDHFAEEYGGKKIDFFIYNSEHLEDIRKFALSSSIQVMIINSQAFNARGEAARRITRKQDSFNSRSPIEAIAETNPILIIDEPQSVEGPSTKEKLKEFKPLFTLRYSATHRPDSIYNMIYRLDAKDAYDKRLVKKIAVKGISKSSTTATESYVYVQKIKYTADANPTATIQFDYKGSNRVNKVTRIIKEHDNLYEKSNNLEEYKNGFIVDSINGQDNSVKFRNGIEVRAGGVFGEVEEDQLRRIQIRETILSHIDREKDLFKDGIKVLSLFFIDEVANYRKYNSAGQKENGKYAKMFKEEYENIIADKMSELESEGGYEGYLRYLSSIDADSTHDGYFSIDSKGRMKNSTLSNRKEGTSNDTAAYDLIMKNKELLLDIDPDKSPVRFIFSHSALREGWDNPNVFQICTLKQSDSNVRKRQEIGRGLRLCVNQDGERMDELVLGEGEVHNVNLLTVIASESYDSFVRGLQTELLEDIPNRPQQVKEAEFIKRGYLQDAAGNRLSVDDEHAYQICYLLRDRGYLEATRRLTDKYYDEKDTDEFSLGDSFYDAYRDSIKEVLDSIYDVRRVIVDADQNNVELKLDKDKEAMPQFKALWNEINAKSIYMVDFDTNELIEKAVEALNRGLKHVRTVSFTVKEGDLAEMDLDLLRKAGAFKTSASHPEEIKISAGHGVKYDLVGNLAEGTGLTRKAIVDILKKIDKDAFDKFKDNPEEFIIMATNLIKEAASTVFVEHITYNMLDERYDKNIFTYRTIKGKLGKNAVKVKKHLYDYLVYDSQKEKEFAAELDNDDPVVLYIKLPDKFKIPTPVGDYNPDWAIAFKEEKVKHIYFVAETKGSMSSMQLRGVEEVKTDCAKKHFQAISSDKVKYSIVTDYATLWNLVKK